ncbi:hypothetical protein PENTCL1PPCAC_7746, partial [Pristionchus entomophagus]
MSSGKSAAFIREMMNWNRHSISSVLLSVLYCRYNNSAAGITSRYVIISFVCKHYCVNFTSHSCFNSLVSPSWLLYPSECYLYRLS